MLYYTIMKAEENHLGQNPRQTPPFVPPTKSHSLLPLPSWNKDRVSQLQYSSLVASCLLPSCTSSYCSPHAHFSLHPFITTIFLCFSFPYILVFLSLFFCYLLLVSLNFLISCNFIFSLYQSPCALLAPRKASPAGA